MVGLPKFIATSVVRGSEKGQSHGGATSSISRTSRSNRKSTGTPEKSISRDGAGTADCGALNSPIRSFGSPPATSCSAIPLTFNCRAPTGILTSGTATKSVDGTTCCS